MSSIIRVRRGDMVVSFRRCSDGLLHVRRFERITLLPTQAARPTSSAQPFRPTPTSYTHKTSAFRRIGKKWGVYREVGVAKAPPCEHCGAPYTGTVKIYCDRL